MIILKGYTILACLSIPVTLWLDKKLKTNLLEQSTYWWFFLIIIMFKFLVNGALTNGIVLYSPQAILGLRSGTIPLEDFIFGFSMVTSTIILWEYFKKNKA